MQQIQDEQANFFGVSLDIGRQFLHWISFAILGLKSNDRLRGGEKQNGKVCSNLNKFMESNDIFDVVIIDVLFLASLFGYNLSCLKSILLRGCVCVIKLKTDPRKPVEHILVMNLISNLLFS